ncbi:MAG: bifunctional phosphoribosyl-AMP cyclohydrolase/phosphoribosyl-ATP diphosphatase HisIE [Chloroflexi bacterium]|nr:bifunctional phosphoribosyl-AMP cyclohydrolase/phosphoribosyl-ATP diphosphatase HisIE [Chloroflexota bacterium]
MLKFDRDGLIPAIVQDQRTHQVLMVAYMNEESLRKTVESGDAWFWSRSRQELWHKGDTSGNFQHIKTLRVDCDADAILVEVHPDGPACHTGAVSCFFQSLDEAKAAEPEAEHRPAGSEVIDELAGVIAQRHRDNPEGSYVAGLIAQGIDRVAKKVGEEATEVIIAAKNQSHDEIVWEVADLWFHTLVLLEASGVPIADVYAELERRRK